MRQLQIQVPLDAGDRLVDLARSHGASTLTRVPGRDGMGQDVELVVVTVPNAAVGPLLGATQDLGRVEASTPATGSFAFEPPAGEVPEELEDVTPRSPFEVVLAGRQASGGWPGFLTYAAAAGVVAWLGLYTETVYLLTGSMLIAPFAGPAMNTAIGVASGRASLLRHSLLRYVSGIALTAVVAAGLTVITGQTVTTGLMTSVLTITLVAFLLPLAAGIAGAMFLVQSEHSSLISGAAVGVLVAASLAPPAGGLGMALALGRPELALHAAYLIALQLVVITFSSVIVLWLYGVRPSGLRYGGPNRWLLPVGTGAALLAGVALVGLQVGTAPDLAQGTAARDAAAVVNQTLRAHPDADLLVVDPLVASADVPGPPRILLGVTAEQQPGSGDTAAVRASVLRGVEQALAERLPSVITHVDLTLHGPP